MRSEPRVPPEKLAAIRAPFLAVGAQIVDTPILQPLGLLLELAGEALRSRLFVVQSEGGEEACLRPDFTVPVARMHLDQPASSGLYLYEGMVFRAAPPMTQNPEEFPQIGLERFDRGQVSPQADVDVVSLAWHAASAGGRSDLSIWLGDVGLFSALIAGLHLPPALAARLTRAASRPRLLQAELARAGREEKPPSGGGLTDILATRSPEEASRMLKDIWALAGIDPVGGRGPAEIAQRLIRKAQAAAAPSLSLRQAEAIRAFLAIDATPRAALEHMSALAGSNAVKLRSEIVVWGTRLERMAAAGLPMDRVRFVTALGHTFDYYDGLTFEVRSAELGPDLPIAVGGRYDGLLSRLGGPEDGRAVGCMVRPGRAVLRPAS